MNAAEQAREQLCKMERDIIRMMAAFRESTGLRGLRGSRFTKLLTDRAA